MLAVLAALAALAGGVVAPRPLHAQAPDLVPVARAYTAAWNAHDLPAVLALFAPDAVVRERRGEVPPAVWDTRDPQVVRAYLDDSLYGEAYDTSGLAWVTGHPQIAAWAAARFAQRHRFATDQHRAAGDTVGWRYREFVDPFQRAPGVSPTEGSAEAVVRDGRITVLTLVQSPASVQRRRGEADAALAALAGGDRPRRAARGRAERPAPRPPGSRRRRRRTARRGLAPGAGWPRRPGRRHGGAAPPGGAGRGGMSRPGAVAATLSAVWRRAPAAAAAGPAPGRGAGGAPGARPRRPHRPRPGRRRGAGGGARGGPGGRGRGGAPGPLRPRRPDQGARRRAGGRAGAGRGLGAGLPAPRRPPRPRHPAPRRRAATWEVRDALGCYWRARPDGFRPAWDVAPGEGTLTVAVAGDRIATLTVVYRPAWEARLLTAQAAPFRTAQARATAAPPATARATPTPAARQVPAAPSTQDRRTPSGRRRRIPRARRESYGPPARRRGCRYFCPRPSTYRRKKRPSEGAAVGQSARVERLGQHDGPDVARRTAAQRTTRRSGSPKLPDDQVALSEREVVPTKRGEARVADEGLVGRPHDGPLP